MQMIIHTTIGLGRDQVISLLSDVERRGCLHRVPVLAGERILGSLLKALLALRQSLVPIVGMVLATGENATEDDRNMRKGYRLLLRCRRMPGDIHRWRVPEAVSG